MNGPMFSTISLAGQKTFQYSFRSLDTGNTGYYSIIERKYFKRCAAVGMYEENEKKVQTVLERGVGILARNYGVRKLDAGDFSAR